jgi:hypothetical protein
MAPAEDRDPGKDKVSFDEKHEKTQTIQTTPMKTKTTSFLLTLGLLAGSSLPLTAAEPNGDQILHQMSDKLAAAKSFSFEATRTMDSALIEGLEDIKLPVKADVTVSVQRPNKIAAHGVSEAGSRLVIADGKTLSILDEKANTYAVVPMHTSIDGLVQQLDEKYGFTPPLAEFAVSNPFKEFHSEAQSVTYLGEAKLGGGFLGMGGVECHHLALKGKEADAELWIAVGDMLPRKLVATFHREGNPQLHIEFHKWNLAAPVTAGEFTFTPPQSAEKIEMMTAEKMQAATKS